MHKKIPKICTGCRVSEAKIYLYHSTEIAKARPHSEEWQTDTSVQKQWSMAKPTTNWLSVISLYLLSDKASDMKDTYSEDSLLGKGKNVKINYANTYI